MAAENWFGVKLLFVSEIPGDAERDRLCEESIIVVQAHDEDHARQDAERLALNMQHSYPNDRGELVEWRFVRILEVQELAEDHIKVGTEVWSRLFYESQATDPEIVGSLNGAAASHR